MAQDAAQTKDSPSAGKVINVVGEAKVVHADGSAAPVKVGLPVYQGDAIHTEKGGAVNIMFADQTSFAVGESAQMSIDKYIYDSAQHSGNSLFSMVQGMFVYSSGLIGKSNPKNVNIETPVGTIGIRGTVFACEISQDEISECTKLAGLPQYTNKTGVYVLDKKYETLQFKSQDATPVNIGVVSTKALTAKYYDTPLGVAAHSLLARFGVCHCEGGMLDLRFLQTPGLHPGATTTATLAFGGMEDASLVAYWAGDLM